LFLFSWSNVKKLVSDIFCGVVANILKHFVRDISFDL